MWFPRIFFLNLRSAFPTWSYKPRKNTLVLVGTVLTLTIGDHRRKFHGLTFEIKLLMVRIRISAEIAGY